MALLGCSKSKLLSIKKTLRVHELIDEIQQSSSKKGRLANRIYLEELEHESTPVSNSDGGSVQKTLGGCQNQVELVLNSATSETEVSDSVIEDEEEKESQTSRKRDNEHFQRKVARVTRYDRDYIWDLVHDQLKQVALSRVASDYAMIYFDNRYEYALEHMKFAERVETIAEYVFNGILSEWTKG